MNEPSGMCAITAGASATRFDAATGIDTAAATGVEAAMGVGVEGIHRLHIRDLTRLGISGPCGRRAGRGDEEASKAHPSHMAPPLRP